MKASELIEHLKSYIDITGGDCEVLVFDKAEGVSCDINETTSDGDYVFLHISSDKYTTKTPE
jgi:MinD superfamily P-loop ATPase